MEDSPNFYTVPQLEKLLEEAYEETPSELFDRIVFGVTGCKSLPLGGASKDFYKLCGELGRVEFAVYLQVALEHFKEEIQKKMKKAEEEGKTKVSFYPALLLQPWLANLYATRRESVLALWENPLQRFRDPMFEALYEPEYRIAERYLTMTARGESPDIDILRGEELLVHSPMLWASTEWDYDTLMSVLSKEQKEDYECARAKLQRGGHARRLYREKERARLYASVNMARQHVGDPIKFAGIRIDSEQVMAQVPLVHLFAQEALRIRPPVKAAQPLFSR